MSPIEYSPSERRSMMDAGRIHWHGGQATGRGNPVPEHLNNAERIARCVSLIAGVIEPPDSAGARVILNAVQQAVNETWDHAWSLAGEESPKNP